MYTTLNMPQTKIYFKLLYFFILYHIIVIENDMYMHILETILLFIYYQYMQTSF